MGRPLSPKRRAVRSFRSEMALTSTIYNFDVELADSDRGVYETLAVRAALHPSETEEYLWTRVLAYCLEYEEGGWVEPKPVIRRRRREEDEPSRGSRRGAPSPVGVRVIHPQFGEGVVVASEGVGDRAKLTVQFRRAGMKKILAAFAELSHAD